MGPGRAAGVWGPRPRRPDRLLLLGGRPAAPKRPPRTRRRARAASPLERRRPGADPRSGTGGGRRAGETRPATFWPRAAAAVSLPGAFSLARRLRQRCRPAPRCSRGCGAGHKGGPGFPSPRGSLFQTGYGAGAVRAGARALATPLPQYSFVENAFAPHSPPAPPLKPCTVRARPHRPRPQQGHASPTPRPHRRQPRAGPRAVARRNF